MFYFNFKILYNYIVKIVMLEWFILLFYWCCLLFILFLSWFLKYVWKLSNKGKYVIFLFMLIYVYVWRLNVRN